MKRRNFLKGLGALIGIAYVNPTALIPEVDAYVTGAEADAYYANISWETDYYDLGSFEHEFIMSVAKKLADRIDAYIWDNFIKGELNAT